jgi:hypothetical protein
VHQVLGGSAEHAAGPGNPNGVAKDAEREALIEVAVQH